MRLKSSIFISALLRQVNAEAGFGAVINKGSEEAGAIFISHAKAPGAYDFYGPAPQSFFTGDGSPDRMFELLGNSLTEAEVSSRIASQLKFDPDCWVVELEMPYIIPMLHIISDEDGG